GSTWAAVGLVMLLVDIVALAALRLTRAQTAASSPRIIGTMNGMEAPTPRQHEVMSRIGCAVAGIGVLTLPLWMVLLIKSGAVGLNLAAISVASARSASVALYYVAASVTAVFLAASLVTQPPLRRRAGVVQLMRRNPRDALRSLARSDPAAFGPHYRPP